MAVPFSRPEHPSRRSRDQRPSRPNGAANRLASHFVSGGGRVHHPSGVNLDHLSLTSRIAFYALYEAWRLLQELTGYNNRIQRQQQEEEEEEETRGELQEREQQVRASVPDLLLLSEPAFAPQRPVNNLRESTRSTYEKTDFNAVTAADDEENDVRYDYDRKTGDAPLPDLIQPLIRTENRDSKNDYEDHRNTEDEEEDDLTTKSKTTVWCDAGRQLCQVASAFELAFYGPTSPEERALYEAYRRIKLSVMLRDIPSSSSVVKASKAVCRQILLTVIWFLLKKVL